MESDLVNMSSQTISSDRDNLKSGVDILKPGRSSSVKPSLKRKTEDVGGPSIESILSLENINLQEYEGLPVSKSVGESRINSAQNFVSDCNSRMVKFKAVDNHGYNAPKRQAYSDIHNIPRRHTYSEIVEARNAADEIINVNAVSVINYAGANEKTKDIDQLEISSDSRESSNLSDDRKTYECHNACGDVVQYMSRLTVHEKSNGGEKRLECESSGGIEQGMSRLAVHEKTHAGKSKPRDRIRAHAGAEMYKCDYCGNEFRYKRSLVIHRKVHTGKSKSRDRIRAHAGAETYKCDYCGNEFECKRSLVIHKKVHTGKSKSRDRIRAHAGAETYKCDYCGRAFRSLSNCIEHAKIHTSDKSDICNI